MRKTETDGVFTNDENNFIKIRREKKMTFIVSVCIKEVFYTLKLVKCGKPIMDELYFTSGILVNFLCDSLTKLTQTSH